MTQFISNRAIYEDVIPEITWEPMRDDRTYMVVAKESLTDTEWVSTEECANPHFFKVRVKLP